jgi:hypothetical protein
MIHVVMNKNENTDFEDSEQLPVGEPVRELKNVFTLGVMAWLVYLAIELFISPLFATLWKSMSDAEPAQGALLGALISGGVAVGVFYLDILRTHRKERDQENNRLTVAQNTYCLAVMRLFYLIASFVEQNFIEGVSEIKKRAAKIDWRQEPRYLLSLSSRLDPTLLGRTEIVLNMLENLDDEIDISELIYLGQVTLKTINNLDGRFVSDVNQKMLDSIRTKLQTGIESCKKAEKSKNKSNKQ